MKLIVISSSPFIEKDEHYYAYSPYIKELEIWARHSDEIAFFCPIWEKDNGLLISKMNFPISKIFIAKEFNIKSFINFVRAFLYSFQNFYKIYRSMAWADHIHLRCPGNIGLMGCIVQIFFPGKPKTAKYAGNWDAASHQPWSYKLQRSILSNTFLTRNMRVLVYGEWEGSTKNIKSFFTASYKETDKIPVVPRSLNGEIRTVFVGTLTPGKQPMYAVKLIEELHHNGIPISLSLYGNGPERALLQKYIDQNDLKAFVHLMGNQPRDVIKDAYQQSNFVILPSQSEGWPKVIAEGMFWGCLPIATKVSCLGSMLDNGNRGLLLTMDFNTDVGQIKSIINDQQAYTDKVEKSIDWSRKYTLDLFENEIKELLNS